MSRFFTAAATCPNCSTVNTFEYPASINADRRDDLRAAILDSTLYLRPCDKCGKSLTFDPHLTYLDVGRGQWILVEAPETVAHWRAAEADAIGVFELAFGTRAPPPARQLGASLAARLVFGWPALVEKLRCEELGLDDVALEMAKLAVIRDGPHRTLEPERDLRLRGREEDMLLLDWIDPATGVANVRMKVPHALYEDIVDMPDAWADLRTEIAGRMFVDIGRVLRYGGDDAGSPA
jgi:hypothetical protein